MVRICANQTTGLYKLYIQPVGLLHRKIRNSYTPFSYRWLTRLTDDWLKLFFDLTKAFSAVPYTVLTIKHNLLALTSRVARDLTGRKQKVVVNSTGYDFTPAISGVPQGSVLGLLLFQVVLGYLVSGFLGQSQEVPHKGKILSIPWFLGY